jgi:5'-deoxynucleotidase YfbR-like HD superfamily hydrolase
MSITTLVFDWSNTIMAIQPGMVGPMQEWTQVSAMPGSPEMLAALSGRYRLILAADAPDSRAEQVHEALARVGLDKYFGAVFTPFELGARKPDEGFFRSIESVLDARAPDLLMIGDDYRVDILGAVNASWSAAWYNPTFTPAPAYLPMQNFDLLSLDELPPLLSRPFHPSYTRVLGWLQSQPVSHAILAHVHSVAAAAYQMALWLKAAGESIDPILTHRGGLVHDIAKLRALHRSSKAHISHPEMGAMILYDLQQSRLAEIARRHGLFCLIQPDIAPRSWEEKLVYYADKLVEGSHVAGLETRLAALRQRYPADSERIAQIQPALEDLQLDICKCLGWSPAELIVNLKKALSGN